MLRADDPTDRLVLTNFHHWKHIGLLDPTLLPTFCPSEKRTMQHRLHRHALSLSLIFLLTPALALGGTVVGWRTDGTGCYPDAKPPLKWSETENIVWKTPMPGSSYGTPLVLGERIIVPSEPGDLLCLETSSGKLLWKQTHRIEDVLGAEKARMVLDQHARLNEERKQLQREFGKFRKANPDAKEKYEPFKEKIKAVDLKIKALAQQYPMPNRRGAGNTAPTPVSDGKVIYAVFGSGIVSAHTVEGKRLWLKHVETPTIGFGQSTSPVLVEGKLIVHLNDLFALNPANGKVLWQTKLRPRHSTPVVGKMNNEPVLVSPSGAIVRIRDGQVLMEDRGLGLSEGSPVVHDGIVYGMGGRTWAVRLVRSAKDQKKLERVWEARTTRGRRIPSPVVHNGLLYGVTREGILDVVDVKTGDVVYRQRLNLRNVYSSVVVAGDRVYVSDTRGTTVVFQTGRTYKELARNRLDWVGACLVFSGKRLYLRTRKHLYCIGKD